MNPIYLDASAAHLHGPEGTPSGLGVVLVPPFGWDDQSAYRPRRAWARRLAADGHVALRLELPGTGDSGGEPSLAAWADAVAKAIGWLREEAGASRAAVIALGMGGLASIAALTAGVDDLVLWGVPADGRSALRELKAFARLEAAQTGDTASRDDGSVLAGGHQLPAATAGALRALEVDAAVAAHPPQRVLLLGRDGSPPPLAETFAAAGAEVEQDGGAGWGAMLSGPQSAEVPDGIIELTRGWLAVAARDAEAGPRGRTAARELTLPGVRETPIAFAGGRFGVLAEPDGLAPAGITAVLLNAGAIRHIGPNRMWVEAARRFAARGVPTLRVDLEAIGEADGRDEPYGDDRAFYVPELTAQVQPLLDALAARGLPDRFLLAGLCSGSYWAFHAARADTRVRTAVLLNPRLLFWDAEAGSRRELRRALTVLTPAGFRRLLVAERPLSRLFAVLRWLVAQALRRERPAPPEAGILRTHVTRLKEQGQRLELAFSGQEPLHDELERSGELAWLQQAGVAVHPLPLHSHTLKPLAAQLAAHTVLDAALAGTLLDLG